MSKKVSSDIRNGRFVVGRQSGAAFNAVEGLQVSDRIKQAMHDAEGAGETGDTRRDRIRSALVEKAPA